ncbi:MAG TPA: protein kinase [Actinomycetota bacterium]
MTTVLADRYELEEPLGAGGMASVYRGTDRVLDRTVAVKVLDRSLGRDPEFVERFRREARAAAGLTHPGTVAVYDTGEDDGRRFIVMELIDGETLADLLAREAPLDPERVALLAADILEALAAAHDRGLVHRDVKPGNVLLTSEGEPKVADFGIARAATSETITVGSKVLGTAAYLSPEQARGRPVDARCDLYAMGCVLYEMLTGAPPFRGGSPVSVATKHIHEDPPPLPSSVPPSLAAVVMQALEKDPDDRFPDARSMAAAIRGGAGGAGDTMVLEEEALETEAVPAPPAPLRRRWVLPALLGALLLAALIGGLVLAFGRDDPTAASRGDRDRGAAAAGPSPAESPREEAEQLRPQEAFTALVGAVQDGLTAGEIEEKLAREIVERAEDAMEAYAEGDRQKALDKAGDAINALVDGAEQGEVTPERASEIEHRILALQAAIEAYPPREHEEEDDDEDEDGSGGGGPDGEGPPGPDGEGPPGQDDDT